jgi:hypothetical protein
MNVKRNLLFVVERRIKRFIQTGATNKGLLAEPIVEDKMFAANKRLPVEPIVEDKMFAANKRLPVEPIMFCCKYVSNRTSYLLFRLR